MGSNWVRKFRVKVDKIEGRWHIGAFFCVDFENLLKKRDKYLFICFGHTEISIGMITDCEEEYSYEEEYKSKE